MSDASVERRCARCLTTEPPDNELLPVLAADDEFEKVCTECITADELRLINQAILHAIADGTISRSRRQLRHDPVHAEREERTSCVQNATD